MYTNSQKIKSLNKAIANYVGNNKSVLHGINLADHRNSPYAIQRVLNPSLADIKRTEIEEEDLSSKGDKIKSQAVQCKKPIQRLGFHTSIDRSKKVQPWGGAHPSGYNLTAETDKGTDVIGWSAFVSEPEQISYWCHGHSLNTYNRFGYSVYSGWPLRVVIGDEYDPVDRKNTQVGDLAVWENFDHSAIFHDTKFKPNGDLDEDETKLSTKNGQKTPQISTAKAVRGEYSNDEFNVFRKK